jgi:hypothetical protein
MDELPGYLDNSTNSFFRSIFNQADGSCAQASGVGYTYTYEVNRLHNTSPSSNTRKYPSHYTYNFLNSGSGENGSFYTDGWEIIKSNGCPTVATYGGMSVTDRYWMSGYDKYEGSMNTRVKDYFSINIGTAEGLETLKHWMLDHLDGSETGGVVNFAAGVSDVFTMTYDNKVIQWGNEVNHAMTMVGWDDSITYDYNGDGNYTNNIDINADGVVDMKDWEVGALIMVNTWGSYFGDDGKAYIMYKTLAESIGDGGIYNRAAFGIHVEDLESPKLLMRVKMQHNSRKMVKVFAGLSTNIDDIHPVTAVLPPMFSLQGGDYSMCGSGTQPIELSIDISKLAEGLSTTEPVKIFLVIKETDADGSGEGSIIDFSIIDKNGTINMCSDHYVNLNNNTYTFLSITAGFALETAEIASTDISVFPNPTNGLLHIKTTEIIKSTVVYDISGRKVWASNQNTIDISSFNRGLYILKVVNSKGQQYTSKILKQ